MKKIYSSPVTKAYQVNTQNTILAGSDPTTLSIDIVENNNNEATKSANSKESLWDEIW